LLATTNQWKSIGFPLGKNGRRMKNSPPLKSIQEFLVCETLGRGSSGIVHRVKRLRDGHIFAMKAGGGAPGWAG